VTWQRASGARSFRSTGILPVGRWCCRAALDGSAYTRTWGRTVRAHSTSTALPSRRPAATGANAIEAWAATSGPRTAERPDCVQGGVFNESNSSLKAADSGRPARSTAESAPDDPGRGRVLELPGLPVLRQRDVRLIRVRCNLRLLPERRLRGQNSGTSWPRSQWTTRRCDHSRRPGRRARARSAAGMVHARRRRVRR